MQLSHIEGKQPEIVQISWYLECWFIFDDMLINTKSNLPFMGSLRGPSKRPPGRSSPMRHHFYQDRHHHHIYISIISAMVGHWWHTMTWHHSRYQNIDHPPRLKCGSQNACFCQGWSITYPRAVNQLYGSVHAAFSKNKFALIDQRVIQVIQYLYFERQIQKFVWCSCHL